MIAWKNAPAADFVETQNRRRKYDTPRFTDEARNENLERLNARSAAAARLLLILLASALCLALLGH